METKDQNEEKKAPKRRGRPRKTETAGSSASKAKTKSKTSPTSKAKSAVKEDGVLIPESNTVKTVAKETKVDEGEKPKAKKRGRPKKTKEEVKSEKNESSDSKSVELKSTKSTKSTKTTKTTKKSSSKKSEENTRSKKVENQSSENKRKPSLTYVNNGDGLVRVPDTEEEYIDKEGDELSGNLLQGISGGKPVDIREISKNFPEESDDTIADVEENVLDDISDEDAAFVDATATERERNGIPVEGIFDLADYQTPSYGFLRQDGITSENDIYVSPNFIRKFNLKPGELVKGYSKKDAGGEKFRALLYVSEVNGVPPYVSRNKHKFDDMTPLFPRQRFRLAGDSHDTAMRIMDLIAPIGKGQRGLIVAPPKSGKTILLQKIAKSIKDNYPDVELMILLIDERPEEVTDMKEYVDAPVFYSTFDELPSNHTKIAELVLNRARGLVEMGKDVVILLDSITRLARAYNVVQPSSGRTLSGGLDTSALHKPKRFLGSARNTKEGGSLTILATALIETGSKMDDVIFEEFKGTGNMELILDRKLSEKRIFPSIDIKRSGTRREELILTSEEYEAVLKIRRALDKFTNNDPVEKLIIDIVNTKNNAELISLINKKL